MAYEKIKRLLGTGSQTEVSAAHKFVAGSTAGVISQTSIYPMEVSVCVMCPMTLGIYRSKVSVVQGGDFKVKRLKLTRVPTQSQKVWKKFVISQSGKALKKFFLVC